MAVVEVGVTAVVAVTVLVVVVVAAVTSLIFNSWQHTTTAAFAALSVPRLRWGRRQYMPLCFAAARHSQM